MGEPYLFRRCVEEKVICRHIPESEVADILFHCHSFDYAGHFGKERTAWKILQSSFCWPTLFHDANAYVISCDHCERAKTLSQHHEMPLNSIFEVELFNTWVLISWVLLSLLIQTKISLW